MQYVIHLLITLNIYVILAISLDLLVGFAGLISLAQAAFFGVGAYTSALMTINGVPPFVAIAAGMFCAAALSGAIALPALRVRGIHLLIITIAVQIVTTLLLVNWADVTGGSAGVPGIPRLSIFGMPLSGVSFLSFATVCSVFVYFVMWRLLRSPYGKLLQAMRDDEIGCVALGKNVAAMKISAFAVSGAIAAFAGSLYAHYVTYVDPRSFDISISILILLMVMLGGAGTLRGPVLGAALLLALPELLKFVPLPLGVGAALRQLAYGLILVLVVFVRPEGLLGHRRTADAGTSA
ncbi:branched-chain amino acid ABC transporter permease [Bradyrhizobium sp. CSA207]|uniref:branched-chain amino acid ABC transporter permease n=1 Tax=Bradyrhizobium sp. CSA207 TaxID=2698826 RepID=UPI0023B0BAFB|nr:branched-chain amino acid ABC transporter permease [Bradyrhizobium sp. CSA207]MDE5444330.1 branched-chain amino acid ABC transporter permease [Bradyrhizobium sp. CSA207]